MFTYIFGTELQIVSTLSCSSEHSEHLQTSYFSSDNKWLLVFLASHGQNSKQDNLQIGKLVFGCVVIKIPKVILKICVLLGYLWAYFWASNNTTGSLHTYGMSPSGAVGAAFQWECASYLQWMTMGPASANSACLVLTWERKLRTPPGSSGTPWSGQLMYW